MSFFLGFDTETTGLDYRKHQVIQVGAVLCDEQLNIIAQHEWDIRFNDGLFLWDAGAEAVHGITQRSAQSMSRPNRLEFKRAFSVWLQQHTFLADAGKMQRDIYLVGANCSFDYNMMKYSIYDGIEADVPFSHRMLYDVNTLGNFVVGKSSLGTLMKHFNISVNESKRHSALYDAQKHIEVFRSILLADIDNKAAQ